MLSKSTHSSVMGMEQLKQLCPNSPQRLQCCLSSSSVALLSAWIFQELEHKVRNKVNTKDTVWIEGNIEESKQRNW